MAQVNPFNILAFYSYRPSFAEPAPLICSPGLLSFQVRKTTITTVTEFVLLAEDGTELDMDTTRIETACTSSYGYFATYRADTAPAGIADGKYLFRLTLDSTVYYSHPFCVDSRLSNIYEQVFNYSIVQVDPDIYNLTFTLDTAIRHGRRKLDVDLGAGAGYENKSVWVSAGQSKAVIDESYTGTSLIAFFIRVTHEFEGSTVTYIYDVSYDTAAVAGTIVVTLITTEYNVNNESFRLVTFANATDITDMNLLYQTGYIQRLFIHGYGRQPQVINESRFQSNAKGTPYFNSQTIAEKQLLDFEYIPDYLQAVLIGLQNHTTVTMYDTHTGQGEAISRPTFEFVAVENDVILKCTLSWEVNRAFVSCDENMEIC